MEYGKLFGGPLTGQPVPGAPNIALDTVNNQLYWAAGSTWATGLNMLNVQPPQAALTTVTTAQTMFTYTFTAGIQNILNRSFGIVGEAMFSNGVTTPAITISLKIGSVTIASVVGANNANSNTNAPINFAFNWITSAIGATGTDEAHGWMEEATAAAWASGTAVATYVDGNTAASSTYDHTAANVLQVNIAASAALTTVTPRMFMLYTLN